VGHERVGTLPQTKRWREIVKDIARSQGWQNKVADIADKTLHNVQTRFNNLHRDTGIQAAFAYLVSLATADMPHSVGLSSPQTGLENNPSPVKITKNLMDWVTRNTTSQEYAELASRAGADTITEWTKSCSKQGLLFDTQISATAIWAQSANAEGFCQLARSFFSNFTARYLRYFLEREASAQLPSLEARERFTKSLQDHIDSVSRHAFETSKITQSFAAGWFNKHARESRPDDVEIQRFLATAFGKLKEELQRESAQ
jgi:hypothetical protein